MNQNDTVSAELAQPEKGLAMSNTITNNGTSRRKFLGQVGAALAGGAVLGKAAIASGQDYNPAIRDGVASPAKPIKDPRVKESLAIRNTTATLESQIPVPPHTTNGDEQLYPDKSGTYSKGILQDGIGLVNLAAFQTFKNAINSGKFEDFENVITGGPRTQNGPLGGRAFALHRLGLGTLYHVRVGTTAECSCECLGYLHHRKCKHILGLLALTGHDLL